MVVAPARPGTGGGHHPAEPAADDRRARCGQAATDGLGVGLLGLGGVPGSDDGDHGPGGGRRRVGRAHRIPAGVLDRLGDPRDTRTDGPAMPLTDHQRAALRLDDAGLLPVVVQQHDTGEVLMVAWADLEAIDRTLDTGETWFWSRSRAEYWHKGASSGNTQRVVELRVDCDGDVLLALVDQGDGVACHTGERSCFFRTVDQLAPATPEEPS